MTSMCLLDPVCHWLTAWWPCRLLIARYASSFSAAAAAADRAKHHGMSHVLVSKHGRQIPESDVLLFFIFYCAMRCISAVFAVMQCLSVRLSVTFVDHVKMNKHIFEICSPSASHTILVFPYRYQRGCRYSDGNPPNGGVECKGV